MVNLSNNQMYNKITRGHFAPELIIKQRREFQAKVTSRLVQIRMSVNHQKKVSGSKGEVDRSGNNTETQEPIMVMGSCETPLIWTRCLTSAGRVTLEGGKIFFI